MRKQEIKKFIIIALAVENKEKIDFIKHLKQLKIL
jgi:hypothetical protein